MSDNTEILALDTLDGCEFVMVSSTASTVSTEVPSRFRYRQNGSIIWGEYVGDTVLAGRFCGRRDGDQISIGFAHSLSDGGEAALGTATSVITRDDNGRVILVEDFEKEGAPHRSICVQVDPTVAWPIPAPADDPLSVDGTTFVLESSTASTVNIASPTVFEFSERGGIVWGEYCSDTVTSGHCVGVRTGTTLNEYFVHELVGTGETLLGNSSTEVRRRDGGGLELVEVFVLDGVPGRSVCRQVYGAVPQES